MYQNFWDALQSQWRSTSEIIRTHGCRNPRITNYGTKLDKADIARTRLDNQRLVSTNYKEPQQAAAWFGAMQAQDYASVKWAVGMRCTGATDGDVESAIKNGDVVRSWLNRGTLHIAAAPDIRWIQNLLSPGIIARSQRRYKQLELDERTFTQCIKTITQTLETEKLLTRAGLLQKLEEAGISTEAQRGYHILRRTGLEGLICFGPPQAKNETFVLVDEFVSKGKPKHGEEALAEITRHYFQSHGPAGLEDFIWWSGLPAAQAKTGLELNKSEMFQQQVNGKTHFNPHTRLNSKDAQQSIQLLPAFDEYILGYKGRDIILDPKFDRKAVSNNGVFRPVIVIDGQVAGTWRRSFRKGRVLIDLSPF